MATNEGSLKENDSLIQYQQIFDENPAPKYIFDLETLFFLAVNEAALTQYGYTRAEFLSLKATDIRPEEEVAPLKQVLSDIPGVTYYDYGKWRHRRKNGDVFYVNIYAHTTRINGRRARFVMAIDIDQNVKTQQALEENEQNLRAIINNTTDMIWSIDKNYEIISANEPFYQRMQLVTGKRINKINHGDFPEETQRKWIEYYERGFRGESFKTIWHEPLEEINVYEEISINPIVDGDRDVLGLSCISRDVTENYLYTRKIEEQNEQLQKIAWIQSHEVRAPLSNILGLVSLIREGIVPADQQAEVIELINDAANKLDAVITRTVQETHREK